MRYEVKIRKQLEWLMKGGKIKSKPALNSCKALLGQK